MDNQAFTIDDLVVKLELARRRREKAEERLEKYQKEELALEQVISILEGDRSRSDEGERAKTELARAIESAVHVSRASFSSTEIREAVRAAHPELAFDDSTVSVHLRELSNRGIIMMTSPPAGRRPAFYRHYKSNTDPHGA